jgi:hypothetical protein
MSGLAELRSYLDEYAGELPVRLRVALSQERVTYEPERVWVKREHLDTLQAHCPWLKASVTVDTDRLLRAAETSGGGGFQRGASPPPSAEVPF